MIREDILKKQGIKIERKDVELHLKTVAGSRTAEIDIDRFVNVAREHGFDIIADKKYVYVKDYTDGIASLFNSEQFVKKANISRIKADCEKCKFFEEKLGRGFCNLWNTHVLNVAKVGKGCVPFKFFGFSPDNKMRQTQFELYKKALKVSGMSPNPTELIEQFLDYYSLREDGTWVNPNTFLGDWGGDNGILFGVRYNPENNKIQIGINKNGLGEDVQEEYDATVSGLENMIYDWRKFWGLSYDKDMGDVSKSADLNGNKVRPERNFDWLNREDYKREVNKQDTKQYDRSPSNIGDKYPTLTNSFNDADKDISLY